MIDKEHAQTALWALKGMLAEATPEEQTGVAAATQEFQNVLAVHGDAGKVALTMVLMEMAAKGDFQ